MNKTQIETIKAALQPIADALEETAPAQGPTTTNDPQQAAREAYPGEPGRDTSISVCTNKEQERFSQNWNRIGVAFVEAMNTCNFTEHDAAEREAYKIVRASPIIQRVVYACARKAAVPAMRKRGEIE